MELQKKGAVGLRSGRQLYNGSRVSWKLCLDLCSRRWLKGSLSLVKNINRSRSSMPNYLGNYLYFFKKSILKTNEWGEAANVNIKFFPFTYYIRKRRIFKRNCPSFQWGIYWSGTCLDITYRKNKAEIWRWSINQ